MAHCPLRAARCAIPTAQCSKIGARCSTLTNHCAFVQRAPSLRTVESSFCSVHCPLLVVHNGHRIF
eukprot:8215970-Lingulodinium_polyedra.AAC.1